MHNKRAVFGRGKIFSVGNKVEKTDHKKQDENNQQRDKRRTWTLAHRQIYNDTNRIIYWQSEGKKHKDIKQTERKRIESMKYDTKIFIFFNYKK